MGGTDASGRQLSDLAVQVLRAVSENDGEATLEELGASLGSRDEVSRELDALVKTGHLAGPPRTAREASELSYGLLPAGRAALRLS